LRERIKARHARQAAGALVVLLSGCAASRLPDAGEFRNVRVVRTRQAQVDRACRNAGATVQHPNGQIHACVFRRERIILMAKETDPYTADRYLCHELAHLLLGNWHRGRDDASAGPLWDEEAGACKTGARGDEGERRHERKEHLRPGSSRPR
jgi:hypothetical protein